MRRRDPNQLTDREREVLDLLRRDFTNEQIAQRLGISVDGAKYHVSQILSKLGVATREEAAALALGERRRWWAHWPLWAKLGPAGAAIAAGVGLVTVIAMGWGGHGDVEDSLPGVALAESGGHSSTRTSVMPIKSSTASESATASPIAIVAEPTLVATPDVTIVENNAPPTPEESPTFTPTPTPTPACPGRDYQGLLPWGCVQPGVCAQPHVALSLDKAVYRLGEGISVTLDLTNDSPESIVLCYLSGQDFEIFIYNAGAELTNYSREELAAYTAALENQQVLPGWKLTFNWDWDQIVGLPYEQGSPLAPGTYEARGVSTASCNVSSRPANCAGSPPVQFVVSP